ncbi:MAG: DUF4422 domain-containing protein [Bifidobacterium sp.]|uniref:DUF4422 domain-containing protein n=1 Tax=Bifidobacterium fermentum TaxID=3059035 RepID=A0AB39UGV2_9BIFI
MSTTGIYIATQQELSFKPADIYKPIQVGAEGHEPIGYLRDDTEDNISSKNPHYCELTAQYWMWKNALEDVIGLCHYRRYFFTNSFSANASNIMKNDDIDEALSQAQMVIAKPRQFKYTNAEVFSHYHHIGDLLTCRQVLAEKCPIFLDAFDNMLMKKELSCFNMLITRKEVFAEYSSWLFSILAEVEERTDIRRYDKHNARLYGFLSERLMNVWIDTEMIKIEYKPVFLLDEKYHLPRMIKRKGESKMWEVFCS